MAKEKVFRFHQTGIINAELGDGNFRATATMRDWDDGLEFDVSVTVPNPVIQIDSLSIRTITVDPVVEPPPTPET